MIKFLQINLHHCIEASANLILLIKKFNIDIALIQEPWITTNGIQGLDLNGYTLYFDTGLQKLRTCILAKNELNCLQMNQFTNRDQTALRLTINGKSILISSAYFAHDDTTNPPPEITTALTEFSIRRNIELIIGCDANAHHLLWGSTDTNDRGLSVMDFIIEYNMAIINTGSDPTFETRTRREVLDLTLTTQLGDIRIDNWKVSTEISFSDHKYLEFELDIVLTYPIESFRNPRNINWDLFNQHMITSQGTITEYLGNTNDIERLTSNLEKTLKKAFDISCPHSKYKGRKHEKWWNKDLFDLKKGSRKALNDARKYDTDEKWEIYKRNRREFKKQIRKAKRQSFVDMITEIETIKDTSRLRKLMTKQKHVPGNLKKSDGSWTTSANETLDMLFSTHFPGCVLNYDRESEASTSAELTRYSMDDNFITLEKIEWAIGTFGPYKSPGVDGIYPIMLQRSLHIIGPILIELFRACMTFAYVPENWKRVRVVFIPKVGKIQHSCAKDYRPISLSSFLLKTLERILDEHIRANISNMEFSADQHAYIKGKSVESALHDLSRNIEESIEYKEYALACFLDIEGAFNNIRSDAIMKALEASGTHPFINKWIMKALTQRYIETELGGTTLTALATRGTPQGGVISPILWNLVINEILLILKRNGINVVAYADDVVLVIKGKFPNTLSEIMESGLRLLDKWANECGLGINPQKTEMILFHKGRKDIQFRCPKLRGESLVLSNQAKFLGVIFDSKMTWLPNLRERIRKAYAAMYSCQKLMGKTWGLKPRLIHWIYTAIVRPILAHGSLVWWPISKTKSHANNLQKVNSVAVRSITGARKSTATAALCRIMDMTPLDLYVQEHALRTLVRLRQNGTLKVRSYGHSLLIRKFHYENTVTDYMTPHITWYDNIDTILPPREMWDVFERQKNEIEVYTDGSKKENGTGSGIFSETLGIQHSARLNNSCSIFQAELFAVCEAARLISMRPIFSSNITIYIDSQAAIKALGNRNIRSGVVSRCRQELQVLTEQHSLKLCWVPGHNNISGNEKADELARRGADMPVSEACEFVLPGMDSVYGQIREKFRLLADDRWSNLPGCIQTKALWEVSGKASRDTILKMEKHELRMYVGIITGHTNLKNYLKKIRLCTDDLCRWCGDAEEVEDSLHFLCHCPALSYTRFNCFGYHFFQSLDELRGVNPWRMLKYIKKTKLCDSKFR